jgi:hypothetical protein
VIAIAVSAHQRQRRTDCAQFISNPFIAHITQMPDLVRATRELTNERRQFVMRVSDDEHFCHVERICQSGSDGDISILSSREK